MKHFTRMLVGCLMLLMAFAGKSWHVYAAIDNAAYGILAFSDEQSRLTNNIVRFDLVSDKEPVFTGAVAFSETATAGAYAARGYYVATTEMAGSKEMPKTLVRFDIEKGTYTTVGRLSGYESLINDMTYDNSTSTMYAVSRVGDSRSALFTISSPTALPPEWPHSTAGSLPWRRPMRASSTA